MTNPLKFTLFTLSLIAIPLQSSWGILNNAYGIKYSQSGVISCDLNNVPRIESNSAFKIGVCTLNPTGYVSVSGQYQLQVYLPKLNVNASTNPFYLSSTVPVQQQTINVTGSDKNLGNLYDEAPVDVCYVLHGYGGGGQYTLSTNPVCTAMYPPLPPEPPAPPTSCTINNSQTLNVNLGTLERDSLPTDPASNSVSTKHVQVPVYCTGGAVSVNMKIQYAPLTIGGKSIIQSSTDGLGVAISYAGNPLSPSDNRSMNFVVGSNSFDLAFTAVRDPNTKVGDVATGSFTANATLIMTQI
ncbi:fimbrial protein [Lelliottia amnigena]